jgi:hypothetical protein
VTLPLVGQLFPTWSEDLDAIVVGGVVRSRDDDSGRTVPLAQEARDSRRRQYTCPGYLSPGRLKARGQPLGERNSGDPGVSSEEDVGFGALLGQTGCKRDSTFVLCSRPMLSSCQQSAVSFQLLVSSVHALLSR